VIWHETGVVAVALPWNGRSVMKSLLAGLGVVCVSVLGQAGVSSAQSVNPVDPVVQWNRVLLTIVRTPGAQPATIHPTHGFAIMHAAIFDAVNAIERTHRSYAIHLNGVSRFASQEAAAAAAAHEVLVRLYPALQTMLDDALQQSLASIPNDADRAEGIRVGQIVADRLLDLRSHDGADAQPIPYVFGTRPGDYQSTPPKFPPQPQFTHWRHVVPFVLAQAAQFRPGPPPALAGTRYGRALNEIQSVGIAESTAATVDQALTGRFWNGAIQNYWNEIAQTASVAHRLSTADSARLFAHLNLTLADAVIAFYDAKYTYNFWRPVTAIRAADSDGNPETAADPNWLPEVTRTPPDPSYPGAHAVISAAAALVLTEFFRGDRFEFTVTSEALPSVERSFDRFSAAAEEASLSRVFAGVHFRFDETVGERLGHQVARFVLAHLLTPRHGDDDEEGVTARR
jgi:hypothetical protein